MKIFRTGLLLGLVIVLDRLTKVAIIRGATWQSPFLRLSIFENHGLVFSLPAPTWLSMVIMTMAIVVVVGLLVRAAKQQRWLMVLAMSLIALGALSNLLDRLWYGFVIDFVSFGRWFPIFNLADLIIAAGLMLWVRDLTTTTKNA